MPIDSNSDSQRGCEADSRKHSQGRRHQPDQQGFKNDRSDDLAPAGAECPQHAELPRALCDRDRERVEDLEGGHEQRHTGEDEERGLQKAGQVTDVVLLGRSVLRAGLNLDV